MEGMYHIATSSSLKLSEWWGIVQNTPETALFDSPLQFRMFVFPWPGLLELGSKPEEGGLIEATPSLRESSRLTEFFSYRKIIPSASATQAGFSCPSISMVWVLVTRL